MDEFVEGFTRRFKFGEVNRMVGSGGEVIVKAPGNRGRGRDTRIEIGDYLIGLGATHFIESMERPPGPDNLSFGGPGEGPGSIDKFALRGFEATVRRELPDGVEFRFKPLSPKVYSAVIEEVSEGTLLLDPATIPDGTMILSFLANRKEYTLRRMPSSPGANWRPLSSAVRHWNVGVGKKTDFWYAKFPTDDVAAVRQMAPWSSVGQIRFGLSQLAGSRGGLRLERLPANHPDGPLTKHDFCLNGLVTGTRGLDTDFYIGLRTEILCKPLKALGERESRSGSRKT